MANGLLPHRPYYLPFLPPFCFFNEVDFFPHEVLFQTSHSEVFEVVGTFNEFIWVLCYLWTLMSIEAPISFTGTPSFPIT